MSGLSMQCEWLGTCTYMQSSLQMCYIRAELVRNTCSVNVSDTVCGCEIPCAAWDRLCRLECRVSVLGMQSTCTRDAECV